MLATGITLLLDATLILGEISACVWGLRGSNLPIKNFRNWFRAVLPLLRMRKHVVAPTNFVR